MDLNCLSIAQIIQNHPIQKESERLKQNYLRVLSYVAKKYSGEDEWAKATLDLYRKTLLQEENFDCSEENFAKELKTATATKFRPFKFFSYRYCLLADCIFINAFFEPQKGEKIFSELKELYNRRYQKKLMEVFDSLYGENEFPEKTSQLEYIKGIWQKNQDFQKKTPIKVLVTATMSAGKSTLLNALTGKKVNKTQNEACTAKIHSIFNKPYEDGFSYEWDGELNLNASLSDLMDDNANNQTSHIAVGTHFRTVLPVSDRVWLLDTPGVNSAANTEHKNISEELIQGSDADLLIYLLNGEAIGTDDEKRHLLFIREHCKCRIVFVINKVDSYRKNEDSIAQTILDTKADLEKTGFQDPRVVPVSAYAAYLAKQAYWGGQLDEDETDELERLKRKMKRPEFQLQTFYPHELEVELPAESGENEQLMLHSGILNLENIIYQAKEQKK